MWTYDPTTLGTSSSAERLNTVRFLVGDTDTTDQQVQNEEITFALSESGDSVYRAASWVAKGIAAKYARLVDTELDGQLSENYSQLQEHYKNLSNELSYLATKTGASLGFAAGGLSKATIESVESNTDRKGSRIKRDQFRYRDSEYTGDY